MRWLILALATGTLCGFSVSRARCQTVDLLLRYPTQMSEGDTAPDRARPWTFSDADVFRLSQFSMQVGAELRVKIEAADVAIGHCVDGAVWAVLLPRAEGRLTSSAASQPEPISHVWLRFHPKTINRLFPPETVFVGGATNLVPQMRFIAGAKFTSSFHAGMNAMIPEPNTLTLDVDTTGGPRRFFVVDTKAGTTRYIAAFAERSVKQPPPWTMALAEASFDQLWSAFDRDYAMFALRPELDWAKLRDQYRPQAVASKSVYELAAACADMLSHLRDLHVRLTVAGVNVPVFDRPRSANSNPLAHEAILGDLHQHGGVQWTVTRDKIGYIAIHNWTDRSIPAQMDEALEQMRNTRGLIIDVRLNGGGDESIAREVAGRFLPKPFVYAYDQVRNGPRHTDLTSKRARTAMPRGPWRYDRPVVLLIGQKCMSSNESFIGMMMGDPGVTTVGDSTCGASGNPKIVPLPLEIAVSVPSWIDYLPDGTPLDGHGFQPQVPFKPATGAFEGARDDLLVAALERLRPVSLPEKPIAGPPFVPEE